MCTPPNHMEMYRLGLYGICYIKMCVISQNNLNTAKKLHLGRADPALAIRGVPMSWGSGGGGGVPSPYIYRPHSEGMGKVLFSQLSVHTRRWGVYLPSSLQGVTYNGPGGTYLQVTPIQGRYPPLRVGATHPR